MLKLPITGKSAQHPSSVVNNQRCVNYYPTPGGADATSPAVLLPTPGKYQIYNGGSTGQVRALTQVEGLGYCVIDTTFYEFTVNETTKVATLISRGTVSGGSGRVTIARNPLQLLINVDGGDAFIYNLRTMAFSLITDPDFLGAASVVFIDGYFFFNVPGSSSIYCTALNDGSSVSALDVQVAEAHPDKVVGLGANQNELWIFGSESVEVYFNAAVAEGFPFEKRLGATIDVGCAATYSIQNMDNTLIWMDHRRFMVQDTRNNGYNYQTISTEELHTIFSSYSRVDDAFAFTYTENGHFFYVITFPTANATWVYDGATQEWHERASWAHDAFARDKANCCVRIGNVVVVGDYSASKLYIMGQNYFLDGSDVIHRLYRGAYVHQDEYTFIDIPSLELLAETGNAGSSETPTVNLRYSNNWGRTWSNEMPRSLGNTGQYDARICWGPLGTAKQWLFEFTTQCQCKHSLVSLTLDVRTSE